MKGSLNKITVVANLELDEKDIEMLMCMSEYDGTAKYLAGMTERYNIRDWEEFLSKLRSETRRIMSTTRDARIRVFGKAYDQ